MTPRPTRAPADIPTRTLNLNRWPFLAALIGAARGTPAQYLDPRRLTLRLALRDEAVRRTELGLRAFADEFADSRAGEDVDARIGERSEAVLRTAMRGHDGTFSTPSVNRTE